MKVQIEKAVYGGAGLAHQTEGPGLGQALFVPFTLPGEEVEVRLLEQKNSFSEGELVEVLTPSRDRVEPACAHFGQCGGCQYQHAAYPAQVQMKLDILHETLQRAGLISLPAIQPHSGEPWAYRNRVRFRIAEREGSLTLGYNRRGSNEFLAVHECPISAPILLRAAQTLLQLATEDKAVAHWVRNATEVELFTTANEQKLQVSLFVRKDLKDRKDFTALCERLQLRVSELTGAGAFLVSSSPQQRAQTPRQLAAWGAEGISYRAAGEDYWVSRGGFFQVNRSLVDELVRIVTEGWEGPIAWDLYAGAGLFSRVLARKFEHVTAVEAAATDLSRSFKGAGKRAVAATTVEFLRSAVVQRERPQLIVMDPPRAGVGAEVCDLLTRISAPEIVYVSCDPVTLARDLQSLIATGYSIAELHMIDMFPQTFHLETVVVLRR
jgi:23S rRNA (uracil1939-C5)-methyltransferase